MLSTGAEVGQLLNYSGPFFSASRPKWADIWTTSIYVPVHIIPDADTEFMGGKKQFQEGSLLKYARNVRSSQYSILCNPDVIHKTRDHCQEQKQYEKRKGNIKIGS